MILHDILWENHLYLEMVYLYLTSVFTVWWFDVGCAMRAQQKDSRSG